MKWQVPTAGLIVVFGTIFGCGGGGNSGTSPAYKLSIHRLGQLNTGLLMYDADNDDVLPPGAGWMDRLVPYVQDETAFRSPAVQSTGYGYALNDILPGHVANQFANPDTVLTLFDSTVLTRSAVAPSSTMPQPPRYGTHNTMAYLDGHVANQQPDDVPVETLYRQSQGRLRQLGTAMSLYSADNNDTLPLANGWMDGLDTYVSVKSNFRSPLVERQDPIKYGYALSSDVAGTLLTGYDSPSTTIAIFDSTVLTRNATASLGTLPNPPRYGAKNTVLRLDGSVAP